MRTSLALAATLAGFVLGGCQTNQSTRVTVMNESRADLVIDVALADSEDYAHRGVELGQGATSAFVVTHEGAASTPVQVGVRPSGYAEAAAQWLEFDAGEGPYLLRVQGSATDLRFLPSRDVAEVRADEVRPVNPGRLGADPPVNPR